MTSDRDGHTVYLDRDRAEGASQEWDAITAFVTASERLVSVLRSVADGPEMRAIADGLYEVSRKLLRANENLAQWRNKFLRFDFRGDDAGSRFVALVSEYYTRRAGQDFHEMKFRCGDISVIHERNVRRRLDEVLAGDPGLNAEMQHALGELSTSDAGMVAFIYDTVLADIEAFVRTAEPLVDDHDFNGAERARLEFRARSADLSTKLEVLGNSLSDLVVRYAELALRPVDID